MKRLVTAIFVILSCVTMSAQQKKWAVVNLSADFMREEPSYTAELGSQALMGTLVEVLDRKGYWVRIHAPGDYTAWVTDMGLSAIDDPEAYRKAAKWICVSDYARIRTRPDSGGEAISDLVMGDLLLKAGDAPEGWEMVTIPGGRASGYVESRHLQDYVEWQESRSLTADSLISLARQFVGVPYLWGGATVKGFDCSGLMKFIFHMNGLELPHSARRQAAMGREVPANLDSMRPGDLVFFGKDRVTHVALYMGGGKIIHASHLVRINSLRRSDPDFYGGHILAVRRLVE